VFRAITPVFHVADADKAEEFYCRGLGFTLEFAHRLDEARRNPCYLGLIRDGVRLHVSSFSGDAVAGGVANVRVDNVDALHAALVQKGIAIDSGPVDQSWGTREMYVKDADGNCLRFVAG
jgi:uncharacterized glyoxalase superfamily protein PhnB